MHPELFFNEYRTMTGHPEMTVGPNFVSAQIKQRDLLFIKLQFYYVQRDFFLSSLFDFYSNIRIMCVRLVCACVCGCWYMYSILAVRHEVVGVLSE